MALKAINITAATVEDFQQMQTQFAALLEIVQTPNEVHVNLTRSSVMGGLDVTPAHQDIDRLRVKPNTADGFWVDIEMDNKAVFIRLPKLIYRISLTKQSG